MGLRYLHFDLRNDRAEATPAGGLKVPARISRTGIQVYQTNNGPRREYRPADEVFAEDALASFQGAPISIMHPAAGAIDPSNWKAEAVGHLGDDVRRDGRFIAATLYIDDAEAIRQINDGSLVELSAGYQTRLERIDGTTEDGERYDAIQRDIRGNHVALLPRGRGRAGRDVRLRIDSHDNEIETFSEDSMAMTKEELKAELEKFRADQKERDEAIQAKDAELESLRGKCDALESANKEIQAKLDDATSPATVQAKVDARLALVERARKVDPEVKTDGSEREIMLSVLGDRVDSSASDEYIRGAFEARVALAEEAPRQDAVQSLIAPRPVEQKFSKLDEAEEQFNKMRAHGYRAN